MSYLVELIMQKNDLHILDGFLYAGQSGSPRVS